jgi:hypothetical protein
MKHKKTISIAITFASIFVVALVCYAAYHHMGEIDSGIFLSVYPDKAGTKLDSCNLCHSGGSYVDSKGKTVTLGSCQWCHYTYGYDASGNIDDTLNPYGLAYKTNGRNTAAVNAIANADSDGDGYANAVEIAANRYPGNPTDDPTKVTAPLKVYTMKQLLRIRQHSQFMLMNTHKSEDFYTKYSGVAMDRLLNKLILPEATGIMVYAPDGWAQFHPLYPDPDPLFYHVFGDYPAAMFYYDEQADIAKNPASGWCNYSSPNYISPMVPRKVNGEIIKNRAGLKMLLAIKRDGKYLTPGVLNPSNKLDGEGPYRIVPPQKVPGPPDQKSTSASQDVIWPFDENADHNAGYSSRSATIIKVEPLPEGTTDIDTLEAGWPYVDSSKIVIYGSIDPVPNILEKLMHLRKAIKEASPSDFTQPPAQRLLTRSVNTVKRGIGSGLYEEALGKLESEIVTRIDGCTLPSGLPDENDWVQNCDVQKQLYWKVNEIMVLLRIVA